MTLMILGQILWFDGHLFKRILPDLRARLGKAGYVLSALVILAGLILMIVGYRSAAFIPIWSPPGFLVHVNNLLMVLAAWFFIVANLPGAKVWPGNRIRHPMLTSVKIWAFAHLLTNGDLASMLLFGGLLAWAVLSVILINRANRAWERPASGGAGQYALTVLATSVFFGGVTYLHMQLGVWPFPS